MSLIDDLLAQLQGAPLQLVSQQLGLDSQQAAGAISAALPLLMGALGNNAARPQGAEALLGALQDNHSGLDIGGVLGAVLGGGNSPATNGAGILGHIFGGSQGRAEAGLALATGLGSDRAGQLLRILAPVVMAYLAQRMSAGDQAQVDADGLGRMLGQEKQHVVQQGGVAGGLLGSLLDQDGDGQLGVSDLIRLGSGLLGSGKR